MEVALFFIKRKKYKQRENTEKEQTCAIPYLLQTYQLVPSQASLEWSKSGGPCKQTIHIPFLTNFHLHPVQVERNKTNELFLKVTSQ